MHKDTLAAHRTKKPEERKGLRVGLHRIEYIFNSSTSARLFAEEGTKSKISYPDHQGGPQIVPMVYEKLLYKNAFPGVDLVFTITPDGQCKYDVVVGAAGDLADVRFDVTGLEAASTKLDGNQLTCELPFGRFVERVPEAYSEKNGGRERVKVGYAGSNRSVGFRMEGEEQKGPLVVDPIGLIEWGTWFCPPNGNSGRAIRAHAEGVVFAAGSCWGGELILNTTTTYSALEDVWVAKFTDTGSGLQATDLNWCAVHGGTGTDAVMDMDATNDIVAVVGWTESQTGIGTTAQTLDLGIANDTLCTQNGMDGFLMYFDANTGSRTYGTYIGGTCQDFANTVALDHRPLVGTRCYVGGTAASTVIAPSYSAPQFSPYQLSSCGVGGGFIQRYNETGIDWMSWYNGCPFGGTYPLDIAVDQNGEPVMVAFLLSSALGSDLGISFNGPPGNGVGSDLVLSSFSQNGPLNWARWHGTQLDDGGNFFPWVGFGASLAIAPTNNIYLGWSQSDFVDSDGIIACIQNDPLNPVDLWTPLLDLPSTPSACGSNISALSVTCAGTILAVGTTSCNAGEFSEPNAHQEIFGGGYVDGYLIEVEDLGGSGSILHRTYYGGSDNDWVMDVSADDPGTAAICGDSFTPVGAGDNIAHNAGNGNIIWDDGLPQYQRAFLSRFSFDCCPSTITIPDGTSALQMGITLFTNEQIKVEGQWFIDASINLVNCTVRTATGAEIIVSNGAYMDMWDTHINSCEEMWKGIHATDGARLRWKTSSVADAQYGAWLDDGTLLSAYQCGFINNYTGIYIKKPCNGCWNSVSLSIPGCWFRTLAPGLKDPYPGQLPVPGSIGYAGIDASGTYLNISSTPVAGDILFKHLNYGITTGNVGFTVADTRFEDMIPDLTYGNNQHQGAAIYSTGYSGFYGLKLQGLGTALNATATFKNCRTSVWTESMGLRAQQCRVEGPMSLTGITARFSSGRLIDISSNNINVQHSAIDLRFNDGAAQLSVHDNELHFGLNGSNGLVMFPGINVQEMNGTNSASEIRNNQLHCRGAWRGMSLNSASNYLVSENTVAMLSQQVNRGGIELRGCTDTRVTCNTVFGQNVVGQPPWSALWPVSHFTQTGIRHSLGATNYLACNSVDNILHGILFNGWTPGLDLTANNFGTHNIGLELTQGALIGGQLHKGNIWNVQATFRDARWNTTSAGLDVMTVNLGNPLCWPNNYEPSDWFQTTPDPNDECSTIMPQCPSVNFQGGGGQRSLIMDEAVMLGSIENGIYTDETRLTLAYELYLALLKDPALYSGSPYTADFVTLMENSVADGLKDVEQPRKELYEVPGPVLASVQQNELAIEALLLQVKTAMEQLATGGLSPAQEAALQASIASWQQNIENLNTYNTTAMANLDAARAVEAMLLENGAAALASTELIEQNAKAVNEIYLSTIAVSGEGLVFDASQEATLLSIASQCPLLGGNPVYQARSMYTLIDEEMDFDDALICVASGFAVKDADARGQHVVVYPNPNRDGLLNFMLTGLDDTKEHTGTIVLYDVQGQEVGRQSINSGRAQMDVSGLAQGLYQWSLIMDEGTRELGTVTIF
ncbi:MAG: T9SS type A sorting domain-containing protein [Flavobacteriales bacterium]|nr:MAG: T9SS type A sorting domain-containing protein [Flavobacteriales bacterium]